MHPPSMWLLTLLACFHPDARDYAEYQRDLEVTQETASGFSACSDPVGPQRLVLFGNPTEEPVELWYVLPHLTTQERSGDIPRMRAWSVPVAAGDVFRFRREGETFTDEIVVDGAGLYYEYSP